MSARRPECVDCKAERERTGKPYPKQPRATNYGGPRSPLCYSHHVQRKRLAKAGAHERRVQRTYGLQPGDYGRMYLSQNKRCAICRRANGATRKLSVDHDHRTGFVRMLICRPCNDLLGHFRDGPEVLRRAAEMLEDPPAVRAIGWRRNEGEGTGEFMEIWRDVPDYEGWYQASTMGRVRSWKGVGGNQYSEAPRAREPRILAPGETRGGYLTVGLSLGGRVWQARVNRLILFTFEGPPDEPADQACHRNGVRTDNRLENLYWGSQQDNQADKDRHGTQVLGVDVPGSKLTEASVSEIRRFWATGDHTVLELAERFGVSGPTLWKAATGKTWTHVEDQRKDTL